MDRIFLGKKTNGDVGFWVSKPGFDVLTETNTENFLVHPDTSAGRPYMSVLAEVAYPTTFYFRNTQIANGTQYVDYYTYHVQISHGLGYYPVWQSVTGNLDVDFQWATTEMIGGRVGDLSGYGNGRIYDTVRYASNDQPVPGGAWNGTYWYWDPATGLMKNKATAKTRFIVYREKVGT